MAWQWRRGAFALGSVGEEGEAISSVCQTVTNPLAPGIKLVNPIDIWTHP